MTTLPGAPVRKANTVSSNFICRVTSVSGHRANHSGKGRAKGGKELPVLALISGRSHTLRLRQDVNRSSSPSNEILLSENATVSSEVDRADELNPGSHGIHFHLAGSVHSER